MNKQFADLESSLGMKIDKNNLSFFKDEDGDSLMIMRTEIDEVIEGQVIEMSFLMIAYGKTSMM